MEEKLGQEPSNLVKIVFYGPESTGKTTLAKQLAAHYETQWVPEYARDYLQEKWDKEQKICEYDDLLPIAIGQVKSENELAKKANKVLICDTDILETMVYSLAYFNKVDARLEHHALKNNYNLYFLTGIDVPWVEDDLRDRPDQREEMFRFFKTALETYNRNFIILTGNQQERFNFAVLAIDNLIQNMIDFTENDIEQIKQKGITKEKVEQQIQTFKEGIPFVNLKKAAVVDVGINRLTDQEQQDAIAYFDENCKGIQLLKFVPASGAASRMFKAMFNFIETFGPRSESFPAYLERTGDKAVEQFLAGMHQFPFYKTLMDRIEGKFTNDGEKVYLFVKEMLSEEGLNYGFYPKGLLPFHTCKHGGATPFKEHLKEAAKYAKTDGEARLHFTISPQHKKMFKEEEAISVPRISQKTDTKFHVSYSFQKSSTDTIAVTMNNTPFRNSDGSLLFRPGGHGALIENLNDQDADVIFVKNIDNVVIDENLEVVANNKKMLGGILLKVQSEAFSYAEKLENPEIDAKVMEDAAYFLEKELNVRFPSKYDTLPREEQLAILKDKINRPIRICGMVKNEGEPGGGPFWISDAKGNVSLQIIESAQININDEKQKAILNNSTHFNPVDIVCGVKNHNGEKYNLLNYVDQKQGFITNKTKEGKELKALELPGLWNGAMAFWNTIFVEVSLVTFNPVKTINDLLKPSHQA